MSKKSKKYVIPDVLDTIANISSDEVFTSPKLVNKMLDTLPQELFKSHKTTFLDPCAKSGIFLREITKRLIKGLEIWEPNLEKRVQHILKNQVFGISTTNICHLMVKRSLYCSKNAGEQFSLGDGMFKDNDGNIAYDAKLKHSFDTRGRCTKCGTTKDVLKGRGSNENYAYYFIHKTIEEIKRRFNDMEFDVIIGNPPYQMDDGGGTGSSAVPLYHLFVSQAKKMNPRYLTMIIPSRWFSGGKGLDNFRDEMLRDDRLRKIVDYTNSKDCFPGVEIKGGVSYFLWDRDNKGLCEIETHLEKETSIMKRPLLEKNCDILIRFNEAVSIYNKVIALKEKSFGEEMVSTRKPFGLASNFDKFTLKKTSIYDIPIYANKKKGWVDKKLIIQNVEWLEKYKVFISTAYGAGEGYPHQIINYPFIGEKNSCSTETYIVLGTYDTMDEAENALSYVKTKFFRFLVSLRKNTQNGAKPVYKFVPQQDFSENWTDEKLYKKYNLSSEEIDFIEKMIKPMSDKED